MSEEIKTEPSDLAPTDEAGEDMHIHKPKAAHSLREFLAEISVIVVGILIALAGEQAVESVHWRHKIHQTNEALRMELTEDNGPQAYTRMATAPCLDAQLAGVREAILRARSRPEIAALVAGYHPPAPSWDSEAWGATLASDVGSHTSADQMITWSAPYRMIPLLNKLNELEGEELDKLQLVDESGVGLSPAERERMLLAVYSLRHANQQMSRNSRTFLRAVSDIGMDLPAAKKHKLLTELRARFGVCVSEPAYLRYDPYDQMDSINSGVPTALPARR